MHISRRQIIAAGLGSMVLAACGKSGNASPTATTSSMPLPPSPTFSADPEAVAAQAIAFIQGHHAQGVMCCLKHFPGHGSSRADSHLGFVDVSDTWRRDELIPFRRVVEAGLADCVMTAHIFNANLDANYPATLSRATITGLLRNEIGFNGVVLTDDMQMGAIQQYYGFEEAIELTINAGADIVSIANNTSSYEAGAGSRAFSAIKNAVIAGRIPESRIRESFARIMTLKSRLT